MSSVFREGFEMEDVLFWDYISDATRVYYEGTNPHTAPWYCVVTYNGNNCYKSITALTEFYLKLHFRCQVYPTDTFRIEFRNVTTQQCYLGIDGTRHWAAYSSAGLLEDSGIVCTSAQWYTVEIYFKMADAPNGRFTVKVDGNSIIAFSGDTKPGAAANIDNIYVNCGAGANAMIYVEDLGLNDTGGGSDNSWIGDTVISKVYPEGDGAHNNWHGSDGDDADNWEMVNEYPKDDDTTYVYRSGADSGTQDQYDMSDDYDGTNRVIVRIYAECRVKKTAAVAHTLKIGVLPSGGADQMSAARTLYVGAYTRVVGSEYVTNPVTGVGWVEADIDAIEYVNEVG